MVHISNAAIHRDLQVEKFKEVAQKIQLKIPNTTNDEQYHDAHNPIFKDALNVFFFYK